MKSNVILWALIICNLCAQAQIASSATDVSPIMNGEIIPPTELVGLDSEPISISALLEEKPSLLIFYRGGWCPYCNRQLSGIQDVESELLAMGIQIIAISPDQVENLSVTAEKNGLTYRLLSDGNGEFIQKMGLAFKDHKDRILPVPAVYLVDKNGMVLFNYVNPVYKVRPDAQLILRAAELLIN
ncbi:MAG: AhpC/TSA family protein [Reichenbachiella sp.]